MSVLEKPQGTPPPAPPSVAPPSDSPSGWRGRLAGDLANVSGQRWYRIAMTFGPWIVGALIFLAFANSASTYILIIAGTVLIYSISAIGLNLLMGQAGLVSIGNAALMAVGAYTTGILSSKAGWSVFPIPFLVSAFVGGLVGLIIALPALRLRGIYLALATLSLQFFVAFAGDRYQAHTGAVSGVAVTPLKIGGTTFVQGKDFVLLLGVFLALTVLMVRALTRHAPGRMWNALRESELAATAIGVNAARWKLAAFVVSSSIIAVSGSLLGYYNQIVSSDAFTLDFAVTFIVMLILGGMGRISGAILGATIVVSLPYVLTNLTANLPQSGGFGKWINDNIFYLNNGLYGILVLIILLYLPEGITPALARLARQSGQRLLGTDTGRTRRVRKPRAAIVSRPGADAALLQVAGLDVMYQTGARAVSDLQLRVPEGSIVALLGRNGAGKTSTLRAISGFLVAESVRVDGSVELAGRDVVDLSPAKTAALGVVLVPERNKIFPSLTVEEHLKLVTTRGYAQVLERPYFHRLKERLDQPAGLLSGGERQLLALASASLLEPKLLMVDEFSLGLAPVMIQEVARVIRGLRDDGMTILLVEQNAAAALALADWSYLMEGGEVVAEGAAAEMAERLGITKGAVS
ncbi:amino acid/amide ABC transporter membrane protein 2 (HAAT family) /amino acid/amide ABC transporter ATP-binding protein 1 (HAAT family) [Jatrophihabitans sp. GAS493]|uniref:ABC transporter permease subunit n=1 Tax=Jatrophihabitans sp. GAS493 TaxID=1907575 RepID=UPI000BBF3C96|nr:ATP-binding cassette domain-containing protein [Jatrophihabitans sp. GAS493]SOD71766.1 amino acid/amide ABC transporter membrane protein 2 (HAAT family) /amino acid/amide ABC transporter ATP-binding protein 1 (HAAT family) [Jatrophihabitans sp. GAS493]